jgi:hypothetical protein
LSLKLEELRVMYGKVSSMDYVKSQSARGARMPTSDLEHVNSQDVADALQELIRRRESDLAVYHQIMAP